MTYTRRDALTNFYTGLIAGGSLMAAKSVEAFIYTAPVVSRKVAPRVNMRSSLHPHPVKTHTATEHLHRHHKYTHHRRHPHHHAKHLRAQRTLDTPGNRRDLALTMWGEARGYGELGMRAIGHVILNRAKLSHDAFGHGIHGVCHKHKQFSCWNHNDPNREEMKKLPTMDDTNPDWMAFMVADSLAAKLLTGVDPDITTGATFYHADNMVPYWRDDMLLVGVMFGHMFYKPKPHVHHHRHHHKKASK